MTAPRPYALQTADILDALRTKGPITTVEIGQSLGFPASEILDRLTVHRRTGRVRKTGEYRIVAGPKAVVRAQLWELTPEAELPAPAPRTPARTHCPGPRGVSPLERRQAEASAAARGDLDLAHLRIAGPAGLSAWDLARLRGETLPGPRPGADPVPAPAGARRRLEALEDRGIVRRVSEGGPEARRYALAEGR